jgi:8-oxo-dGTP pyrophosphatase MutT (NUDIX family)
MGDTVRAAGGVVRRNGRHGRTEFAVIHRPKYDDWTLPKGKLDPGETEPEAARREVEEETGIRCRLDREIGSVGYVDSQGRDKTVRYWLMIPESGDTEPFTPTSEVDELRWLDFESAMRLLSYDRDREILRAASSGDPPAATPGRRRGG